MLEFVHGLGYPVRALGLLLRTPALARLVIIPIVLNLFVGVALYAAVLFPALSLLERALSGLPEWAGFVVAVLRALLILLLFIAVGFLVARFGNLIGSPWYGRLSEEIERLQTGVAPPAEPLTPAGIARDLWRALAFELKKLALVALVMIPLLLLNLVPVIGQALQLPGWTALGALIACLDFLDSPLERRRLRFRTKLSLARRGLPITGGFGLACFALTTFPILNLLAIPLCVAAGTLLYCDRVRTLATT